MLISSSYSGGQAGAFYWQVYKTLALQLVGYKAQDDPNDLGKLHKYFWTSVGLLIVMATKLFHIFLSPFVWNRPGYKEQTLKSPWDVLSFSYSEQAAYLPHFVNSIASTVQSKLSQNCSREKRRKNNSFMVMVDLHMFSFVVAVLLAWAPMLISLVGTKDEVHPLCFRDKYCNTVPGKDMCNAKHACSVSDFSSPCSVYNISLKFSNRQCELNSLTNPFVKEGQDCLLSNAVDSFEYSHYSRFWLETCLYIVFFAACFAFWLYERHEKFCLRIAHENGCTVDPERSRSRLSLWKQFQRQMDEIWDVIQSPSICVLQRNVRMMIRCNIAW
jgi:hypothetical protein